MTSTQVPFAREESHVGWVGQGILRRGHLHSWPFLLSLHVALPGFVWDKEVRCIFSPPLQEIRLPGKFPIPWTGGWMGFSPWSNVLQQEKENGTYKANFVMEQRTEIKAWVLHEAAWNSLCVEKVLVTQLCLTLCDPMALLSMEFSREKYWSGLPFPSPGSLPDLGIESGSLALQANSLLSEP